MNDKRTPPGSISIKFLSGPLAEQPFPVRKSIVMIGRGENNTTIGLSPDTTFLFGRDAGNDIPIEDCGIVSSQHLQIIRQNGQLVLIHPHPQVSAHHARMVQEGGTYRIIDLNSKNHTYVNAEPSTNRLLKLGDEIRIGPYRLVYEANQLTQYDETNFIRIDAIGLKKTGNVD